MKRLYVALYTMGCLVIGCSLSFAQAADPRTCYDNAPLTKVEYLPDSSIIRCLGRLDKQVADHQLKLVVSITSRDALPWLTDKVIKEDLGNAATNVLSQMAESASQSTQNGSTAIYAAGTSLATKSASSLLGIAEEAGAVSSTTSGNSTTLTVNVQQLANFLHLSSKPCYIITTDCTTGNLLTRGASISISLSPTSQSNGLSSLENSALSGLTGVQTPSFNHLTFQESLRGRNRKGVTQASFQKALDVLDSSVKTSLASELQSLADALTVNNPKYEEAFQNCIANLETTAAIEDETESLTKIQSAEQACAKDILTSVESVADLQTRVKNYLNAAATYATARDAALAAAFYPNTFSFEYDLTNNAVQPLFSTYKLTYGYTRLNAVPDKSGQLQFTLNGSATTYNSLEGSSESRLRSAQGVAQLDWKPYSTGKLQAELSAGYYFQYMVANGLIDLPSSALAPGTAIELPSGASVLLNTTGPIHIGQGKLTLSIKNSNFKIPIAITGASRTDLIKADHISGNFGVSYDFSSLFSK
jgi:hypothetical protein